MKVKIANRVWSMSKKEYKGTLEIAKEQVPFGIYAVEKGDYAELLNEKATSMTNLKNKVREYKAAGYKVYANGR